MEQNDMELIYDKFSNTIYRTAFSYCKNHADAEDITSDVFIKCFTGKYAYDSDEHLKAWLIAVLLTDARTYSSHSDLNMS